MPPKERLYLFDTTLRDGAQTAGIEFSLEDKISVVRLLEQLGVDYIEGGYPGANVVDAVNVARLMTEGALYFDTRTEAEFKAGHVPGAKWLPYIEKSAKDTDYDTKLDSFDTSKLPADKAAPLVFACNGAECWKSYKASHAAIKAGYSKVHWFRGGLPEWRTAERQVANLQP